MDEVPGRGQPQRTVAGSKRDDGLHRALAEGARADSVARLWSCSAPATISDADAEPPLISRMSGLPLVGSPGRALKRCVSSELRPWVETISPFSRKASDTEIAWSSRPPGLLRRSMGEALDLVGAELMKVNSLIAF